MRQHLDKEVAETLHGAVLEQDGVLVVRGVGGHDKVAKNGAVEAVDARRPVAARGCGGGGGFGGGKVAAAAVCARPAAMEVAALEALRHVAPVLAAEALEHKDGRVGCRRVHERRGRRGRPLAVRADDKGRRAELDGHAAADVNDLEGAVVEADRVVGVADGGDERVRAGRRQVLHVAHALVHARRELEARVDLQHAPKHDRRGVVALRNAERAQAPQRLWAPNVAHRIHRHLVALHARPRRAVARLLKQVQRARPILQARGRLQQLLQCARAPMHCLEALARPRDGGNRIAHRPHELQRVRRVRRRCTRNCAPRQMLLSLPGGSDGDRARARA